MNRPRLRRTKRSESETPIRWSKVATAQARIAAGYYERSEVKQMVVDALLKELRKR